MKKPPFKWWTQQLLRTLLMECVWKHIFLSRWKNMSYLITVCAPWPWEVLRKFYGCLRVKKGGTFQLKATRPLELRYREMCASRLKHQCRQGVMHLSIACPKVPPPPPPGDGGDWPWWGGGGGGQMYPKSPPQERRKGQKAPPTETRRSQCKLASVNVPHPVTHHVVKFPTPGKVKWLNPPWSRGGGGRGGGVPRGLACNW